MAEFDTTKTGYVPVPHEKPYRYQEGDLKVTRGKAWTGPGCHNGCDVLLYTDKNGKLVKCEGDEESPFNNGRLCVRCLAIPEVTNSKDRLLYPMKRDPKDRGKDKWERISWEEAIDLAVEKLQWIKDTWGAETVLFVHGTGRDIIPYHQRLSWTYGSPNQESFFSGLACYMPRIAGMTATVGCLHVADASQEFMDRYDNPEYKVPEVMVIWGTNPLIANADGFFGHWVIDLMKRGMKIIVIDPRVTWLSARSVLHLRVRPGTDAALSLGILNVIINEDLYDHDFVENWCYGFDELKERVQEYPVEKVADICWIPKEKIYEAARIIAKAKPATLQWGVAVDMTKEALPAGQAITAIFEITGNIDVPGGFIPLNQILDIFSGWGKEFMPEGQSEKAIGQQDYPLYAVGLDSSCADVTIDTLETDQPYKLHGSWLQTSNSIACMGADPKRVLRGLLRLDYNINVDLFMTPTIMAAADLVLPAATFPERDGISLVCGIQQAGAINKVTQVGECKSDMEINLLIGKRLCPEGWPWENVEEMFNDLLSPSGVTLKELRDIAPAYIPFQYKRYEKGLLRADGEPGFNTATGKVELYSTFYESIGLDPLPYFEEPEPGPGSTPEMMEEFPLVLTTGARRWSLFHSEHRQIGRMRAMHPDPLLDINPATAEKYGVKHGDWVWVENFMGRAKRKVNITPVMPERIISSDHGWWFPEGDPEELYDVFDLNINNLVPFKCGKSGFGSNYKTTLVKIYKIKPGEEGGMLKKLRAEFKDLK